MCPSSGELTGKVFVQAPQEVGFVDNIGSDYDLIVISNSPAIASGPSFI